MTRQLQKPEGPFDDFKKRFAFNDQELSRALRITGRVYEGFSDDDLRQSGERVHALLFEASEEHPLEFGQVSSIFGKTTPSDFASNLLFSAAYPRWKMEGLLEGRLRRGARESILTTMDDDVLFWPVKKGAEP